MPDNKGLIFIVYFNDVSDGAFEFIPESHGIKFSHATDIVSESIVLNLQHKASKAMAPAGTLICYDTKLSHRAGSINERNTLRKALFFQIDTDMTNGEQFFINSALIPINLADQVGLNWIQFMGFGLPNNGGKSFPQSNIYQYKEFLLRLSKSQAANPF